MYWSEGVEQADKEQEHSTVLQPPQDEVSSTKDWSCIRNIRTTRIYKHTDSFILKLLYETCWHQIGEKHVAYNFINIKTKSFFTTDSY